MPKMFWSIKDIRYIKDPYDNTKAFVIGSGGFSKVKLITHIFHPEKLYALKKLYKKDQ